MSDIKKDTRDKLVEKLRKSGVDTRTAEKEVDKAITRQNNSRRGEK